MQFEQYASMFTIPNVFITLRTSHQVVGTAPVIGRKIVHRNSNHIGSDPYLIKRSQGLVLSLSRRDQQHWVAARYNLHMAFAHQLAYRTLP